jgi:hypothetical protein
LFLIGFPPLKASENRFVNTGKGSPPIFDKVEDQARKEPGIAAVTGDHASPYLPSCRFAHASSRVSFCGLRIRFLTMKNFHEAVRLVATAAGYFRIDHSASRRSRRWLVSRNGVNK